MSKPTKEQEAQRRRADEELRKKLPPGVKLFRTFQGNQGRVLSVAFDPQGETLASGNADMTVKLWAVQSGKLLRTFQGHLERVLSVAFDPQGGLVASASQDRTMKLWEAHSGKLLRTLEGHQNTVQCVAFGDRKSVV